MAKLDDIRGCKINTDSFGREKMQSLLDVIAGMGIKFNNQHITKCAAIYVSPNGFLFADETSELFQQSPHKEIFFYNGAFHDCEKTINTERLRDIRNCKINTDYLSHGKMQSLLNAAIGLHVESDNKHICSCSAIYITHTNILHGEETLDRFSGSPRKEIFFYNGNFYGYDIKKIGGDEPKKAIAKINAGCTNKEELLKDIGIDINEFKNFKGDTQPIKLDHQPGDVVFNKNGTIYEMFLCDHPLQKDVSLVQCNGGEILEVLNSNILSMSDFNNLTSEKIENAKDLHALYASCVTSVNPMAVILPFDKMETEGCDIWIKFSEAMERKHAEK